MSEIGERHAASIAYPVPEVSRAVENSRNQPRDRKRSGYDSTGDSPDPHPPRSARHPLPHCGRGLYEIEYKLLSRNEGEGGPPR